MIIIGLDYNSLRKEIFRFDLHLTKSIPRNYSAIGLLRRGFPAHLEAQAAVSFILRSPFVVECAPKWFFE
jgi:hypothetical protein